MFWFWRMVGIGAPLKLELKKSFKGGNLGKKLEKAKFNQIFTAL